MRTNHLYVLIYIRIKGQVSTVKHVLAHRTGIFTDRSRASFVDLFCYLCFTLAFLYRLGRRFGTSKMHLSPPVA